MAVTGYGGFHPVGEGVHAAYTYAVESAGHFICPFVELSAGMEPGENQLKGAYALCGVHVHRNTTSVVLDPDNIVILQSHGYL